MTSSPITCTVCNHALPENSQFCMYCGARTPAQTNETPLAVGGRHETDPEIAQFEDKLRSAVEAEYEILEPIGQGGFSYVYKARDLRLGRNVAIKVIRPDLAGASAFLERFRREGVALAKLRHPAVVPIYDIRASEELIYYVMPHVEGENLRNRLERMGKLPPFEAHRVFSELADAVAATHRAGIVHRDIKPENVMLEGRLRKVLLMDFGIAREVTQDGKRLTGSGVLVGTPTYMSPEQAAGDSELDQRSDIYSLGVLAYHMVAGRLPFTGTPQEIIAKHITEIPVPVRDLTPSVPKSLSDIIARCLAKSPSDRFESAMDLWRELQTVSLFPVEAERQARASRVVARVVAALALLIGAVGGYLVGDRSGSRHVAVAPPATDSLTSVAFVSDWLAHMRALVADSAPDSLMAVVTAAFDSNATVTRTAVGLDLTTPRTQITPQHLLGNQYNLRLLAGIPVEGLEGRQYGSLSLVTGAYNDSISACGTALFTLERGDLGWKTLHLLLLDSPADCAR